MNFTSCGLLHSDICALTFAYNYTQLFAVNHVLRRLPMPRHSPCALISFTICSSRLYLSSLTKKLFFFFLFAVEFILTFHQYSFSSFRIFCFALLFSFQAAFFVFHKEYISIYTLSIINQLVYIQIYPLFF